jgi:hypothetical protein
VFRGQSENKLRSSSERNGDFVFTEKEKYLDYPSQPVFDGGTLLGEQRIEIYSYMTVHARLNNVICCKKERNVGSSCLQERALHSRPLYNVPLSHNLAYTNIDTSVYFSWQDYVNKRRSERSGTRCVHCRSCNTTTKLTATSVVTYLCFHIINMLTVMKVKFSLSTPRTLMWVGGTSPLIRNFVTRWRYWSASHSVRFTPKERTAASAE